MKEKIAEAKPGLGGISTAFLFATLLLSAMARAESLPDPTRPPAVLSAPAGNGAEESGPVLQSVTLSARRKTAIISGEVVPLGGKFGDATLVRLSEKEAVLKKGETLQTLKLFPDVEKRMRSAGHPLRSKGHSKTNSEAKRKER